MDEFRFSGGKMYFGRNYKDGDGMRVGKDFFISLSRQSFRNMRDYYLAMDRREHLFMYRERQDASFLMPALFDVCDGAAMCEAPVDRMNRPRGHSGDEAGNGAGWLDYWCYYRNLPVAIEAKHAFFSMTDLSEISVQKWDEAIEQLDKVKAEDVSDQGDWLSLALMTVVYWNKGKEHKFDVGEDLEKFHQQCMDALRRKSRFKEKQPNIWSYWVVPEDSRYIEMTGESYPAVGFIGRLEHRP